MFKVLNLEKKNNITNLGTKKNKLFNKWFITNKKNHY